MEAMRRATRFVKCEDEAYFLIGVDHDCIYEIEADLSVCPRPCWRILSILG